jgi:beta-lactam-binding protein with PASTA domain
MATRRELPDDFAAALERVPEARDRFFALPADRQARWVDWVQRARGRRRAARIDDAIRRLLPPREEVAEPAGPPPERWWLWLLLLLLLVVAGLLLWYFLSRGSDKRTVPDVVGLRAPAAARRLRSHDLNVVPSTAASPRPLGVVFAQRPGAGAQVDKGQDVTISISGGPSRKPVPNVTDLPLATAQAQLTTAGFKTSVNRVASTRQKDVVTGQDPAAGVTAVEGATVTLDVSNGTKPVVVPSLVGSTQGSAVTALTRLGLTPKLQNVSSQQPAGQVVSQKPPAGKEVDKGSTVVLNVSRGTGGGTGTASTTATTATTATVTTTAHASIPAVSGLAIAAGLRRLNTAGFRPVVRYVPSSQRAGLIVAEAPTGTATRAARVRVRVSEGPSPATPVTISSVAGEDQAAGAQALQQAGFKVLVLFRKTADQSEDGVVLEQQPAADASIPRGSYVAIFVGRFSG